MSMNPESMWTEQQTAMLRDLWETELPCSRIAGEINRETRSKFSRNAIIGKVYRLGLTKRVRVEREPPPPKPRGPGIFPDRFKVAEPVESMMPPPDFLGVLWEVAVDDGGCMYPEGEGKHMLFCGQPRRDDSSFCKHHHQLCWVKARVPAANLNIWRAA